MYFLASENVEKQIPRLDRKDVKIQEIKNLILLHLNDL